MTILVGDCRTVMRTLEPESVDAVVCERCGGSDPIRIRLTKPRDPARSWPNNSYLLCSPCMGDAISHRHPNGRIPWEGWA